MNPTRKNIGWIFAGALIAMVAIFVASKTIKVGLEYKSDDMLKAGTAVATALFVITLFVERTMAVVYALIFGDGLRDAELRLDRAKGEPEEKAALQALADELGFKERFRILLSFAAGLFVSVAGARTLEGLLIATAPPDKDLFFTVDVVLTAGLIAGGSNGLAFIIQILKERMSKNDGKFAALRTKLMTTS